MVQSNDKGRRPTKPPRKINLPLPRGSGGQLAAPTGGATPDPVPIDARAELDRRIATAPIQELPALIRARGAVIRQDEWRMEGAHIRQGRTGVFYAKIGFSVAAAIGGGALVVAGFGLPGFFLIGGAAAVYVPDYVKSAVGRLKSSDSDAA